MVDQKTSGGYKGLDPVNSPIIKIYPDINSL